MTIEAVTVAAIRALASKEKLVSDEVETEFICDALLLLTEGVYPECLLKDVKVRGKAARNRRAYMSQYMRAYRAKRTGNKTQATELPR